MSRFAANGVSKPLILSLLFIFWLLVIVGFDMSAEEHRRLLNQRNMNSIDLQTSKFAGGYKTHTGLQTHAVT